MKRYINKLKSLVLVGAATLSLTACGDFLVIEPKNQISEDNFWNEKADINQMTAGAYNMMQQDEFIRLCIMWGETRSDEVKGGTGSSKNRDLLRVLNENLISTNVYTKWISFYAVISRCNVIIARAPEVNQKDPSYTESDMKATIAEMSFLRDLCYFYLVRAFKDVPYYTDPIQSDSDIMDLPAVDGDKIVRDLIADLESVATDAYKAYPSDNESAYNSNRNRVTQNAIYALLTDLCLWDAQYQKAVDYSQKVIDAKYAEYVEDFQNQKGSTSSSIAVFHLANTSTLYDKGYPLYPCYNSISDNMYGSHFNNIFGGDQNSFESIFELAFTYTGSSDSYISNTACGALYGNYIAKDGNAGRGLLQASDNLLGDIGANADGPMKYYRNKYDVRYYTDIVPDADYSNGFINKYVASSVSVDASTTPYKTNVLGKPANQNRNWIFYRLTDVMLMQAEAYIELGGENLYTTETDEEGKTVTITDPQLAQAFHLIWAVNRRSYMTKSTSNHPVTALQMKNFTTKSSLRELCMEERQRELMFEGKRWFDLVRRCHHEGNSVTYIKSKVTSKNSTNSELFTKYAFLFWPYNYNEVKNNPSLSQKSDYGSGSEDGDFENNY